MIPIGYRKRVYWGVYGYSVVQTYYDPIKKKKVIKSWGTVFEIVRDRTKLEALPREVREWIRKNYWKLKQERAERARHYHRKYNLEDMFTDKTKTAEKHAKLALATYAVTEAYNRLYATYRRYFRNIDEEIEQEIAPLLTATTKLLEIPTDEPITTPDTLLTLIEEHLLEENEKTLYHNLTTDLHALEQDYTDQNQEREDT